MADDQDKESKTEEAPVEEVREEVPATEEAPAETEGEEKKES